jgi:hypothetical protein
MSMPPADPPPPVPDPTADVTAVPPVPRLRGAPGAAAALGARAPSVPAEWTTTREVPLECAGCGAVFVLSYKYRFVEGLAATVVRCPGCKCGREYYLPVNAFDVLVAAPDGDTSPPRTT